MFDQNLIRKINSGRCLILVGSGPSCEIGYPSWYQLAHKSYQQLKISDIDHDSNSYDRYLTSHKYPEFFSQLERDLDNNRHSLIDFIKPLLKPDKKKRGLLYEIVSRWPFACYLTTNYDDELSISLAALGAHFTVLGNRPEDFSVWRDGVRHIIQKLHSDLNHPNDVVITSADYSRLQFSDSGQYFRDRLSNIFNTFDVLIVGHSLSDPDIGNILEIAKKNSSPEHPIYFISSNCSKGEETELFERYNIVLIRYDVSDDRHTQLLQILRTADRFIVPRSGRTELISPPAPSTEEMETAISIFLYRKLQGAQPADYLSSLILSALASTNSKQVSLNDITSLPLLQPLKIKWEKYDSTISESLVELENQGYLISRGSVVTITDAGESKVSQFHTLRKTQRAQAFGQLRLTLETLNPHIETAALSQCLLYAEDVIVSNFTKRGAAIANAVFSDRSSRADELSDIFALISDYASRFDDFSIRSAFIDGMYEFIMEPNPPQREYLAAVSQGFFLYHALGLDPKCGEVRTDVFRKTLWLCDSSVMLPLVATGCHNHDYAVNLFHMLGKQKALICTTPRLLQEIWEHLNWAIRFVENTPSDTLEYLRAALVEGSYKQNLFLDGYIILSAEGMVGNFTDYINMILPSRKQTRDALEANIKNRGIEVISISDLPGFIDGDWSDLEEAKVEIQTAREERGTYRAPLQVESESEILIVLKNLQSGKYAINGLDNLEHFYFVSQSQIIDRVSNQAAIITWSPESVYRYVSALSDNIVNPDLLQQCMLHEYYYAGISFIDKSRYEHFFGPSISAAKTSYLEERANYVADMESSSLEEIDEIFERTSNLEKPFFSAQMAWYSARASKRREETAIQRALDAEGRVKTLEIEREQGWKIREERRRKQEEATRRNSQDPKHLQKRLRQAKKRRRKK